jgi:Tfp pilus assembly protein PilF
MNPAPSVRRPEWRYSLAAYDHYGSLKPGWMMVLVMLYSLRHIVLVFLLYFPLMPGRVDMDYLRDLLSVPMVLAELPALLLIIAWRQRQRIAARIWGEHKGRPSERPWHWLWRHGRWLLLMTLILQTVLMVDAYWLGWLMETRYAETAGVFPLHVVLQIGAMAYVLLARRWRDLGEDFPTEPPSGESQAAARNVSGTPAHSPPGTAVGSIDALDAADESRSTTSRTDLDALSRTSVLAWQALGIQALRRGELKEAARFMEIAVALDDENWIHWRNLCEIYRRLGHLEAAIAAGRAAVQLQRDEASVHYNLALALADAGDPAAAIRRYRVALRLNPTHARAWNNLGVLHRHTGQLDSARQALARALIADPWLEEAKRNLSDLNA